MFESPYSFWMFPDLYTLSPKYLSYLLTIAISNTSSSLKYIYQVLPLYYNYPFIFIYIYQYTTIFVKCLPNLIHYKNIYHTFCNATVQVT